MKGALVTVCVALMGGANAFVVPGPSKIVSGRPTRASTSQVIVMGRGDTRTTKGKRMRHSYGKCRPQKQKEVIYFEGEIVKKAAPVARRWENIEYDEAAMPKPAPPAPEAVADEVEAVAEAEAEPAVEEAAEPVAEAAAPEETEAAVEA